MRSRFLFLLQRILSRQVTVTLKDGNRFDGIFFTATPFPQQAYEVVLKQLVPYPENTGTPMAPGSTLRIPFDQVRHLHVLPFVVERAGDAHRTDSRAGISTDAQLSKQRSQGKTGGRRQLVNEGGSWSEGDDAFSQSGGNSGVDLRRDDIGAWDQFAENERRFGVQNTFREELYTSKLDRSKVSREEQERADQMAQRILSSSSSSSSLDREEASNKDENDEMLYSGVLRDQEEEEEEGQEQKEGSASSKGFKFNPNADAYFSPSFQPQQPPQQQPVYDPSSAYGYAQGYNQGYDQYSQQQPYYGAPSWSQQSYPQQPYPQQSYSQQPYPQQSYSHPYTQSYANQGYDQQQQYSGYPQQQQQYSGYNNNNTTNQQQQQQQYPPGQN